MPICRNRGKSTCLVFHSAAIRQALAADQSDVCLFMRSSRGDRRPRLARWARGCNIPGHEEADLGKPPGDRRACVRRVRLCPMAQQPAVRPRPPGLRPPRCELRALHVGKGLAARLRSPVESQPELAPPPAPAELAQPAASLESFPSAAQSAPTQRHAATRPCQLPPAASFRAGQVSRDRDVDGGSIARRVGRHRFVGTV